MSEIIKKAEAIIFAVGRTISEQEVADIAKEDIAVIHIALKDLKEQYEKRESPLLVIQEGDGWKLTVREKYMEIVQQINPHTELGKAILETLAVVAWKQPATQSEIIKIRTNKAYEHIKELEDLGFIAKHKHGRTYLIKVTGKFFDYFDLPESAIKETFKDVKDSEEAQTKLIDHEKEKDLGLEIFETKEEAPKETVGGLEVFEERQEEEEEVSEEDEDERNEEIIEKLAEGKNPIDDFIKEENKPAPQEEEKEPEERELDPGLEEMTKKKEEKKDEPQDKSG